MFDNGILEYTRHTVCLHSDEAAASSDATTHDHRCMLAFPDDSNWKTVIGYTHIFFSILTNQTLGSLMLTGMIRFRLREMIHSSINKYLLCIHINKA